MYSMEEQSPMKTAGNIPCKAKRRLFLEEEKGNDAIVTKIADDDEIISADDESKVGEDYVAVKVIDKDDGVVSSTKAALSNLILIITTFEDSTSNHNMQILSDQVIFGDTILKFHFH